MNEEIVKDDWKQLAGRIKAKWGRLTDDEIQEAQGNTEYLIGKLQERYGLAKEQVEQNLRDIGYDR
ncbi:MAG TPA: CsbD family protein [Methylophilus sp.]|uniref:CsbD family protein n=1 Tax=Methylophilus sp. TaxID=29541 RepID=UPI002D18896F|nr:CsbD family protein [Methylophilus sp.]HSH87444.1 CsbD family protein [Methylophilus sp.]